MRFSTLLLLLLLLPGLALSGYAQAPATQVMLNWQGEATIFPQGTKAVKVPTFAGAVFGPGQRLPSVAIRLEGYVTEVQLQEARYEPLTAAQAAAFAGAQFPKTTAFRLSRGTEKRLPVTFASLVAVRRGAAGQLEKLVSFAYSYRTDAPPTQARTSRTYAPASVLRQGEWYKIGVPNSGIFKLDKNYLRTLGLPVQSLNPAQLQLFGNADGGMVPQANSAPRPDDLQEVPLYFAANAVPNAAFDDDEYFLFYSRGPHTWTLNSQTQLFQHRLNLYTDTTYYFLTVGTAAGRRVTPAPTVSGPSSLDIQHFTDRRFHELELVNLLRSGRQWLGEGFNANASKTITFANTPDLVAGAPVTVTASVATAALPAGGTTSFRLTLNGANMGTQSVVNLSADPSLSGSYPEVANTSVANHTSAAPGGAADLRVGLTYSGSPGDPSAVGYLDYLEVQMRRQLRLSTGPLEFRSLDNVAPNRVSAFVLQNAPSNAVVWDVTDAQLPRSITPAGGRFLANTSSVREYVAFSPATNFEVPRSFGRVANQNLHALGLPAAPVDLLIVTPPVFKAQAEELATHRRTHDRLRVAVVTTDQVYNEFSSGGQDITAIRDLAKMLYDRQSSTQKLYILLFGDASYDYKSDPANDANRLPAWWRDRQLKDVDNQNFVPTYESVESFAKVGPRVGFEGISYCSDDFFAFLDDNEGEWQEDFMTTNNQLMDAAVGRLPIRFPRNQPGSTSMAKAVVAKFKAYDHPSAQGKWRNRITFVADDADGNLHITDNETAAAALNARQPVFQQGKVYMDMFPQVSTSGGQRSPDTNAALDAAIEQGSLVVNYAGHGGPRGWTDEQILTNASVLQLQNSQRLTFMFTGTCDFAWYDDPGFNSAGEQVLTDVTGGAIGLLTTTRLVYSGPNQALANRFYEHLFQRNAATKQWPRLGDAVTYGKNFDSQDLFNRNFTLLGDPSMHLAMPKLATELTRLVDDRTNTPLDTIQALQRVRLEGEVKDPATNTLSTAFNGKVQVTVYEKPTPIRTLGNGSPSTTVMVQKDVIYDGQATVRNGRFSATFVVPKDINYQYGFGKISLYAFDAQQNIDAHGANPRLTIGGASPMALTDTIPPRIRLYMDDSEAFVFGGVTSPTSMMLGRLRDESGINTAGTGIGHELTATLDNDPSKVIVLNEYYTADTDSFQSGRVRYLFKNLTLGPHVLKVKAWDTFNNSAERELEFIVARNEKLALEHVLNYPNPFAGHTSFHFDHNRAGEDLDVQVQIFTVSGKLVRTLTAYVPASDPHVKSIEWDGRDDYQDQLARGVYVYRINVRASGSQSQASKFEKLVLLN